MKTNGDSVAYGYDPEGRRVRKYASGTTTYFVWDGDNLLMETTSSGSPIRKYAYLGVDQPFAITTGGSTYYYVQDEEGNVTGLWDQSRNRVADYLYDPFGYQLGGSSSLTQPLRWKGREFHSETGPYYMRARYYDPRVWRFISEDPLGVAAGINPYIFADGDPVNGADPSGLSEWYCTSDYTGGPKIGNDACHYELDPVVSTAHGGSAYPFWMDDFGGSIGGSGFGGVTKASVGPTRGGGGGGRGAGGKTPSQSRTCTGTARVLKGNSRTIGRPGGFSGPSVGNILVTAAGAAVIPSQWGGKAVLRPFIGQISGLFPAVNASFQAIVDVIGGAPPEGFPPHTNAGDALMILNPGRLIIELPGPRETTGFKMCS